jgi:D-sedoheptulose 7-phosphate isomerase
MSIELIQKHLDEHRFVLDQLDQSFKEKIKGIADLMVNALSNNKFIFWCGNGGSASDAQHIAAELMGRYKNNRRPLKSIALNSDTSVITCISNDFSYEEIFKRQIDSLGSKGDIFVGISTSGQSQNILCAMREAKMKSLIVIGLLGKGGGEAKTIADHSFVVPSDITARIQEMHIMIGHMLCDLIEHGLGIEGK